MLAVEDLHVSYGSVVALRGVSIAVEPGEIVAVIGPNGAGKSTLMRSIAGLVRPSRGAIRFQNAAIAGQPAERLVAQGLSLVPEGRRIFGSLTVSENIQLGATPRTDRRAAAVDMDRMLALFPILKERFHQKAGKLSGGEQQMLAIARALMAAPKLLMLDEPSLGLAPLIVRKVYEAIAELRQQGVTVLVVEQAVHVALTASDRTYVMSSGAIVMAGRFFKRSPIGIQMRAAAEDFDMARLVGVKADRVIAVAFALSGILAGFVSLYVVAQGGSVSYKMGVNMVLVAFVASVIGGVGSLPGAALGGFLLGIVSVALQAFLPEAWRPYRDAFVFLLFIAFLLWRPQGILARRADRERV